MSECSDAQCYEQAFGNLSFERGPRTALAEFGDAMRTNRVVESDCHRIAHTIGSAALARYEGKIATAFSQGASTCWSGYYHGILERAFIGANSRLEMGSIARSVCEDSTVRASTWLAYQCVHGLGHGLMIQGGYDLQLALSICDDLRTDWDRTSCFGGTFMENLSSSYGVRSRWLKDDDLVFPCNSVGDRYEGSCYLLVTSRILQATGYDWEKAARTCAGVERKWVATCFQSYGRDASGFTRQSARRIIRLCALAGHGRADCVYGAARDVTANDAGGDRAAKLCRRVLAGERSRCFNGIGTIIGTLEVSIAGRRAACARFGERDARACLRGAGAAA
ncbi:MAG: hypothetical protein H0V45_04725 [Actinobacteria bacterium]|nr:hypothetical protein [Actinomycetota bacterium]